MYVCYNKSIYIYVQSDVCIYCTAQKFDREKLDEWGILKVGMGGIENFIHDDCHLKYHGYCEYHGIK